LSCRQAHLGPALCQVQLPVQPRQLAATPSRKSAKLCGSRADAGTVTLVRELDAVRTRFGFASALSMSHRTVIVLDPSVGFGGVTFEEMFACKSAVRCSRR
jgi:hypothetical protein